MQRASALLLRLLLVAAFVPVLALALVRPAPILLLVFAPLTALAFLSLRLGTSPRWRIAGLLLALAVCGAVWSLAIAAAHVGAGDLIVP